MFLLRSYKPRKHTQIHKCESSVTGARRVFNTSLDEKRLKTYTGKMRGKSCSILKPGFAVSTHFTELHHLSASINSDSPRYIESEVSANEIFKHLKSLKTNLLNVLPSPIKSSICNYIRPVITKFHDLLCDCVVRVCVSLCSCVFCMRLFIQVMG